MSSNYTFLPSDNELDLPDPPTVCVTGAGGRIGTAFVTSAADEFPLILLDHPDTSIPRETAEKGRVVKKDLLDLEGLTEAFRGADVVLHLAADPSPSAPWEDILPNNIQGTYHAFTAAKAAGCKKIVYASSIHAVSAYPKGYQIHADDPVNPGDIYGVSKCFGEAMGRYMSTQHQLACIAVRIGSFASQDSARDPDSIGSINLFASKRDLIQLFSRAIKDTRLSFAVLHGVSRNRFNRLDISTAQELLGYEPKDDFTELNPKTADLDLNKRVTPHTERQE
jgi:nucleoside-diphosphate-sugar epimerase